MPKDMAHSHLGVACDGRYIYVVSGQYGPQCRAPIARVFALDTETKKWNSLPPLPYPRYGVHAIKICMNCAVYPTVEFQFAIYQRELYPRLFI